MFAGVVLSEHLPALESACKDSEDYNPKLQMLEDILLTMIDKNQASYHLAEQQHLCVLFVCVRACVHACVRGCVRACVRACACVGVCVRACASVRVLACM